MISQFYGPSIASDDFLVAEEIFQVCDLKVSRHKHDDHRNDTETDDTTLDLRVFVLERFFRKHKVSELSSKLLDLICDLGCLQLDWAQMLLGHNVAVVLGLNTCLNREIITSFSVPSIVHVLDADLVVAIVESSEMVSQLFFIGHCCELLTHRISDSQH